MSRWSWAMVAAATLVGCGTDHARPGDDGESSAEDPRTDANDGGDGRPGVLAFLVSQVYHDFPSLLIKEWGKFEIFFDAALDRLRPEDISTIHVDGPELVFDFRQEPFEFTYPDGYVLNDRQGYVWYQKLRPEFLADGTYTATVTFRDGRRQSLSRELRTDRTLLDFYLAHRAELVYTPSEGTSPAADTVLHWTTLHDLGGPDAYYNVWISPGEGEAIDADTARGDTIFQDAVADPVAGFNNGSSRMGSADDPLPAGPQTWQPEILDSNRLPDVGMVVFPEGRHFTAE